MEIIESVGDQPVQGFSEEENENSASKLLSLAKTDLDKGEFESVVDLLRIALEQSPLGEIHSSQEFFFILEGLFHINTQYFEQMIPLLERHRMKVTWTKPYYFSIIDDKSGLVFCHTMVAKLNSYEYDTAARIIATYADSRIKIDAYIGLALKFQETHLTEAISLAEKELEYLLEDDALSYIEYGVNIARTYLAFDCQKELEKIISDMGDVLSELSKMHGNLPGIVKETERLNEFKEEATEFKRNPKDIQLTCASTSYVIISNPNPDVGRAVILFHPDRLLFDGVNGFVSKRADTESSFFKFLLNYV